jgi:Vam6/Vps39-like protein vacuolar protein sorting-associated protein 39
MESEFYHWRLQIFTTEEAQLPRPAVIDYLEKIDPMICARYIEFLIDEQKYTESAYHNRLAELYLDVVMRSTKKSEEGMLYRDVFRAQLTTITKAKRKEVYAKLMQFINASEHYHTDRIFSRLPSDGKCTLLKLSPNAFDTSHFSTTGGRSL